MPNKRQPKKAPEFEEVKSFCKEKGFEYLADQIFSYYEAGKEEGYWFDGGGNLVRNWKMKLVSVWFDRDKNPRPRKEQSGYGENIKTW